MSFIIPLCFVNLQGQKSAVQVGEKPSLHHCFYENSVPLKAGGTHFENAEPDRLLTPASCFEEFSPLKLSNSVRLLRI